MSEVEFLLNSVICLFAFIYLLIVIFGECMFQHLVKGEKDDA